MRGGEEKQKKTSMVWKKRVYKRCYKVQIEVSVGSQCQSVNVSKGCGKLWPCFRAVAECRGGRGVKSRQGFNSIRTHTILIVQQKRGNMATLLLLFFFFATAVIVFLIAVMVDSRLSKLPSKGMKLAKTVQRAALLWPT